MQPINSWAVIADWLLLSAVVKCSCYTRKIRVVNCTQPASNLRSISSRQLNAIWMTFHWRAVSPILPAYWDVNQFWSLNVFISPILARAFFVFYGLFQLTFIFTQIYRQKPSVSLKTLGLKTLFPNPCWLGKFQMHMAQRKELYMHKPSKRETKT